MGTHFKERAEELISLGYNVTCYPEPEMVSDLYTIPDLILVSLDYKGMLACEILKDKKLAVNVPILGLSNNSSKNDITLAFRKGCVDLVQSKESLVAKVSRYLKLSGIHSNCHALLSKL